ncbi:MAG: hypothetical protein EON60_02055 [Alphaproteobacteria bacterium]|nr:MAG: hypothetical protein EON60_02055 [Alphaproteobacteria bacterium]
MSYPARMNRKLVYLTIFLEGYVVLAIELLLMRQLTPFVGSATDIFAIIIAAVLLPLAVGYHMGGRTAVNLTPETARSMLTRNFTIAALFFMVGLVHIHLNIFFTLLDSVFGGNHWLKTGVYCAVFALYPVYLLGQTVPILSVAMPKDDLSRTTGTMLFYSTLGSFCGSIFSTLVLMAWIGVHNTFNVTLGLLLLLIALLGWGRNRSAVAGALIIGLYVVTTNSDYALRQLGIVQNNTYSQVDVMTTKEGARHFRINHSSSSAIYPTEQKYHAYVNFIDRHLIGNMPGDAPKTILVIGAGGFTQGRDDPKNIYTYIDIDPDLQATAEKYFLKEPLGPNKLFVAQSARSFLRANAMPYDMIIVDAYSNHLSIPQDLVTVEFFRQVKEHLKPGGMMVMNVVTSPIFADTFSRTIDGTLREVFPLLSRNVIYQGHKPDMPANVIYVYSHNPPEEAPKRPYTDLLNRYFLHTGR